MGDAKTSTRVQLSHALKQTKYLEHYIDGWTYQQIAEKYGINHSTVWESIQTQLKHARARRNEAGDLLLELQIARYTDLYKRCIDELDAAEDGREMGKSQLINAARAACDSLTKVLGFDKGTTITISGESALDRDIRELTERMTTELDSRQAALDKPRDD